MQCYLKQPKLYDTIYITTRSTFHIFTENDRNIFATLPQKPTHGSLAWSQLRMFTGDIQREQ